MKNNVKKFREVLGLSQEKLGKVVGVSRQTINSIENNRYSPSIELAFKLSRAFQKSIEEIFIYCEEE